MNVRQAAYPVSDIRGHHRRCKLGIFALATCFRQVKRPVEGFEAERKARQAAEAANKAKSELLATISHELRTPMEAVVAMGELLLATPLDETQQRHAETLLQSSRRLLNALNDVLDFSRVETGRFEADPVAFDLHALIHDVAADLQAHANDKGLTGSVDIGTSCPRHVITDATRLRQVLMGLIDNSLKYTSIGSVRLHASAKEETAACSSDSTSSTPASV